MNQRRKVVVTGASSGIGRATAVRFAADGCDVCVNARRTERLHELVKTLPAGDHITCPGDYSDPEVVQEMGDSLKSHWGRVDVLVNCAGVAQSAHVIDSAMDAWRTPLDTMVEGAERTRRVCLPRMQNGGP